MQYPDWLGREPRSLRKAGELARPGDELWRLRSIPPRFGLPFAQGWLLTKWLYPSVLDPVMGLDVTKNAAFGARYRNNLGGLRRPVVILNATEADSMGIPRKQLGWPPAPTVDMLLPGMRRPEAIAIHELAHERHVELFLLQTRFPDLRPLDDLHNAIDAALPKVRDAAGADRHRAIIAAGLSPHGATNQVELIAEGLTEYVGAAHPRRLATAIGTVFDRWLGRTAVGREVRQQALTQALQEGWFLRRRFLSNLMYQNLQDLPGLGQDRKLPRELALQTFGRLDRYPGSLRSAKLDPGQLDPFLGWQSLKPRQGDWPRVERARHERFHALMNPGPRSLGINRGLI